MTRLRIKPFHHSQPIGGYTFMVADTVLTGDTPKDVIAKIAEYRRNSGLPAGDPHHDLAEFTRTKYPWLVMEVNEESPDDEGSEEHLAREYVTAMWARSPVEHEEVHIQKERFQGCLGCPNYRKLNADKVTIIRATVLSPGLMPDIVRGDEHGFCEHHLWVCSVACTMKVNKEFANPEKCDNCWYKPNEQK